MAPIRSTPSSSKTSPFPRRNPASPSNNTIPVTRKAAAGKAAEALTEWKTITRHVYETDAFRAQVEAAQSPTVLCYNATPAGRSPPLSQDGDFGPVITLIQTVARLLLTDAVCQEIIKPVIAIYRRSIEAQNQFSLLHPGKVIPKYDHVLEFVTNHFPEVVFHETVRESWGSVNKLEEEGAERNEMFLSNDLVLAYLDTQVCLRYSTQFH